MTTTRDDKNEIVSIKIKHRDEKEVLVKQKAKSIIFANVKEGKDGEASVQAGMAGEFSLTTIQESLEAILTATAMVLRDRYDFLPIEFIKFAAKTASRATEKSFSNDTEHAKIVQALLKVIQDEKIN